VENDDLSLLSGMTEKEWKKLHDKGIFTVTQLSHTFRPRRRPKRFHNKREKYHHSLRALAIRQKKIHIVGSPEMTIEGTPVYLDVEGIPDRVSFLDATQGKDRALVRDPNGSFTVFDAPNAANTFTYGINDSGAVVGFFFDQSQGGKARGFVRIADNTPPTTTATPSPGPNTNGWNNTNVTVTLNATDNPGGSGVKQIQFALGGAQNTGWQTVVGNAAAVTISAEGTTVLSYYATDNAGNQETAKTLTVRIDKTPPVISGLPALGWTSWPPNQKLIQVATVTAADALSGLASGSFHVTGTSNEPNNDPTVRRS
jgi:hypothetical protein